MMSSFLDTYLLGIQSGKHDMNSTKCIGESIAETRQARQATNALDDAAITAAAQIFHTLPRDLPNRMDAFDPHRDLIEAQARQSSWSSSNGASSSSGFTPPIMSSSTPSSGMASGQSQNGSATCASISSSSGAPTPDILEWTNQDQMDFSGAVPTNVFSPDKSGLNLAHTTNLLGTAEPMSIQYMFDGNGQQIKLPNQYEQGGHIPTMGASSVDLSQMQNHRWASDGSQIVWGAQ